ncbi:PLP-dependent aminotransferase family protein [Kibdelosporangium phytohabitans]|uniref:GntR family transcriptional regulator n=1 Tax=Kibdelosporangium phytohabitans TaxID=860235 RepID=A0A0N9I674_9PSEU|nr:PLP-dependent aminotransferase family protein [Kibdelosporangium phytohabitans]ALG10084.1 GntR family transcriptional regulator [Kibdelosporangium phytohabitans]MBE1461063.1 GntR family transcriptional regulator/MocR family aminotransferase [Kibdelosporangium phytohabitans]
MDFHVSLSGRGDLSARIYRELLAAILDGRLRPGERLPPTRELARRLEVSRTTVTEAYERLTAEGFLVGRVGAGTFVTDQPVKPARRAVPQRQARVRARRLWESVSEPSVDAVLPFDFQLGVPDGRLFPLETWRRLVARELRAKSVHPARYADPAGHAGLRQAIARFVGVSRSVVADAEDVVVTQGAQQALDVIGRVLVDPGDVVAVEEPGYSPARRLFQSLGARVVAVPVDGEGIDVTAIPAAARLVYTTPSHQFPLGTAMSLARRTALLAWAHQRGAVIVEDDYDSEFRFSERPLQPLQSIDRGGRVVYVGSFSKIMLPMLRVGFLVAPPSLRATLRTAKQLADMHGDPVTQAALARFIEEGLLARHIRKATREYAARHELITTTLRSGVGWLELVPSSAGLHVCARTRFDPAPLVARARADGVAVQALADFCAGAPQHGIVLGYGGIEVPRIAEGLRRLAAAHR